MSTRYVWSKYNVSSEKKVNSGYLNASSTGQYFYTGWYTAYLWKGTFNSNTWTWTSKTVTQCTKNLDISGTFGFSTNSSSPPSTVYVAGSDIISITVSGSNAYIYRIND